MMEQETTKVFEEMVEAVEKVEVAPNYKWIWLAAVPVYWAVSYLQGYLVGEWIGDKFLNEK